MKINMEDIFVRYVDMPTKIKGMTVLDEDGNYNVYINPRYSIEMQKIILNHELEHIRKNHFYSDIDIKRKEQFY